MASIGKPQYYACNSLNMALWQSCVVSGRPNWTGSLSPWTNFNTVTANKFIMTKLSKWKGWTWRLLRNDEVTDGTVHNVPLPRISRQVQSMSPVACAVTLTELELYTTVILAVCPVLVIYYHWYWLVGILVSILFLWELLKLKFWWEPHLSSKGGPAEFL
jgi:hypothetical protein